MEKRKLRLGRLARNKPEVFNFDSANPLLYKEQPIISVSESSNFSPYVYFGETCQSPSIKPIRKDIKYKATILPRRQRTRQDPLTDEVYHSFHKKMKREEITMSLLDKKRMLLEVQNLEGHLRPLSLTEWMRQLPKITHIVDRSDPSEMARKRDLTKMEIGKLLKKHTEWKELTDQLLKKIARFESNRFRKRDPAEDSELESDGDDDDENIVLGLLEKLQAARAERRLERQGLPTRIILRNGFDLVFGPCKFPTIERSF